MAVGSPAVARRAVDAEHWNEQHPRDLPVLVHGQARVALAAWCAAESVAELAGIDVAHERDRNRTESVHRSLAVLADLPRTVPVTVGLGLESGWRDTMSLVLARGRAVRFSVSGVDAPRSRMVVDAIRAAVAEGCAFSWARGPWRAVTDPLESPLPGILNVLLATALALRGADHAALADQLGRTDPVDLIDAVKTLSPDEAWQVRELLRGFALVRPAPVLDALAGIDLLPKTQFESYARPLPL